VAVNSVCLVNEKKKHMGGIKDFSQIDLSNINWLRIPSHIKRPLSYPSIGVGPLPDFIDISSIDQNAFADLTNLNSLHIGLCQCIEIDLKHFSHLKEFGIERKRNQVNGLGYIENDLEARNTGLLKVSLPSKLESLSILGFNVELNSLTHLSHLSFLELWSIYEIIIRDSESFNFFKKLKNLHIENCSFSLNVNDDKDKDKLNFCLKYLDNFVLNIRQINSKNLKISFENLSGLRKFSINMKFFAQIDSISVKKLSLQLEELELYTEDFCDEPSEIKKVFDNFTKLKKLSLTDIGCLEKDFFKNLSWLEELYFENVGLREIQSGAFDGLNKLTSLDISNNHLSKFEPGIFDKLSNLETLELSFNPLNCVQSGLFNKLNKLKSLSLWNCSLVEIHVGAFAGLFNLEELNLFENDLEDMKEETLSELATLKSLHLGKWNF
jgi:hypothetical protein